MILVTTGNSGTTVINFDHTWSNLLVSSVGIFLKSLTPKRARIFLENENLN